MGPKPHPPRQGQINGRSPRERKLQSELCKYQLPKLVIGTIRGKPTFIFANIGSPDEVTKRIVLKTKDGRNAIRHVFKGDDGEILLEDSSSVAIFPLTRPSLRFGTPSNCLWGFSFLVAISVVYLLYLHT